MKFWTMANGFPGRNAITSRVAGENGWIGEWVSNTQDLSGDPYVALAVGAHRSTASSATRDRPTVNSVPEEGDPKWLH